MDFIEAQHDAIRATDSPVSIFSVVRPCLCILSVSRLACSLLVLQVVCFLCVFSMWEAGARYLASRSIKLRAKHLSSEAHVLGESYATMFCASRRKCQAAGNDSESANGNPFILRPTSPSTGIVHSAGRPSYSKTPRYGSFASARSCLFYHKIGFAASSRPRPLGRIARTARRNPLSKKRPCT